MTRIATRLQQKAIREFRKTRKSALGFLGTVAIVVVSVFSPGMAKGEISSPDIEANLDRFMSKLQTELNALPGVSVSIVQGDEILLMKGYGVADIHKGTPFTAGTYSYIASGTKAFVGLTIATLVDRGELDLDVPVGLTYLSDIDQDGLGLFADVTLGQLLTHTHGLDGEAIEFRTAYTGDFTSNIFWNLIGKVEAAENGHAFDYSNFGYVAASYILEHIYNENWQTLVERTVLAPAGMTETVFQVSGLLGKPYAMPHRWMGTTQQIPVYKRDNTMHAAGGQFSTGRDMTRWLKLNINDGRIDGRQVLPASAVALTTAPLATLEQEFYSFRRETYGLGWYDSDYEGERLMHHFGAYSGYRAHISMMPRIGLGISILSNDLSPPSMNLPDMIAAYVYDIALGKENVDEKFDQQIAALAERMAPYVGRTMPERPRNAPDNESEFAGVFENDIWGVWELREDSNVLRMHWGNSVSDLTYTERDGEKLLRFEVAGNGYLARPVWRESGALDGLIFRDSLFKRQ